MRWSVLVFAAWSCGQAQPLADHHQHFLKAARTPPAGFALDAAELVRQMDATGIKQAVVLSIAYQRSNPNRPPVENEEDRVREENDWTAAQVAQHPGRLIAFCGINPLKGYALGEIGRCARDPHLRRGLKLHFGNSDVILDDPAHVAKLRAVFAAADKHRMPIVAHLRANYDRRRPWGEKQARIFLEQVMPAAPHVVVQVAHAAGAGYYDDDGVDEAFGFFARAIAQRDRRARRLYFDLSVTHWEAKAESFTRNLRTIGMKRLLFASDAPPAQGLAEFRRFPLSARELRQIERNQAPYLR